MINPIRPLIILTLGALLFNGCAGSSVAYNPIRREVVIKPQRVINKSIDKQSPFKWWKRTESRHTVSFHADIIGTHRNVKYLSENKPTENEISKGITDVISKLSPPPVPPPKINTFLVWIQPQAINTAPFYAPLLQIIQSGPGPNGVGQLGGLITLSRLQQITPQLLVLGRMFQQNPNLTISQLLSIPQRTIILQTIQSILQPIGMWNQSTLLSWYNYIIPSQQQTKQALITLYSQLLQSQNLPPLIQQTITTMISANSVNPIEVIQQIKDITERGDAKEIAEKIPGLIHSITAHEGFSKPQIYIYGSRSGRKVGIWPYKMGMMTERRFSGKEEVHVLTEDGNYFINNFASGTSRYWVGPDDITMSYVPIKIKNGKINSLDLIASNLHVWHKRASGGDPKLLNRASTPSTSLISLDIAFLKQRNLHLKVVGGSIPTATLSGIMGELEFKDKENILNFRIGGGFTHKNYLFDNYNDIIGYMDCETKIRTPYLELIGEDYTKGIRAWSSLTIANSGMINFPMDNIPKNTNSRWNMQGETRIVPEFHTQLVTPYTLFELSAGLTTAIVPGGDINLEYPEKTLSLYPIRGHIETKISICLSKIINEWNLDLNTENKKKNSILLELSAVTEFSKVFNKARIGTGLNLGEVAINALLELEHWRNVTFTDIRLGGGLSYSGFFVTGLHSLKNKDYRLELGIDISI